MDDFSPSQRPAGAFDSVLPRAGADRAEEEALAQLSAYRLADDHRLRVMLVDDRHLRSFLVALHPELAAQLTPDAIHLELDQELGHLPELAITVEVPSGIDADAANDRLMAFLGSWLQTNAAPSSVELTAGVAHADELD